MCWYYCACWSFYQPMWQRNLLHQRGKEKEAPSRNLCGTTTSTVPTELSHSNACCVRRWLYHLPTRQQWVYVSRVHYIRILHILIESWNYPFKKKNLLMTGDFKSECDSELNVKVVKPKVPFVSWTLVFLYHRIQISESKTVSMVKCTFLTVFWSVLILHSMSRCLSFKMVS